MPTLKDAESREDRGRSSREESESRPSRRKNGWAAYNERREEAEEEREARESRIPQFWLKPGESAVVQILDDEPFILDCHTIKDKDGKFTLEPCQLPHQRHCLMCREGFKKIWRPALKILDFRGNWDAGKKVFKYDEPIEKIWILSQMAMGVLEAKMKKKKRDGLKDMVVEVTRTGKGKKDTSYVFEDAFDAKDERIEAIRYKEKRPPTEEALAPKEDDELIKMGFEKADDY